MIGIVLPRSCVDGSVGANGAVPAHRVRARTSERSMMDFVRLRRGAGAGIAVIALAGGLLTGCSFSFSSDGGKPLVSKSDLQKDISDRLEKGGITPQSVTCSDDLEGEVGKSTRCEVVLSATNSIEPIITVTKVDGSTVSYDMTPAVSNVQLANVVATLVGHSVAAKANAAGAKASSVTCASGLEGRKGLETRCNVTDGSATVSRIVQVTKVDGFSMEFALVPILPKLDLANSLMDQLTPNLGRRPDSAVCAGDLEGKPGNTVDCTVTAGPRSEVFALTVTNVEQGTIHYSFVMK